MAIEAPGQSWVTLEGVWSSDLIEVQTGSAQCGIGFPEPFIAPEVGQTGIHTHPSTGRDDQAIGLFQQFGCVLQRCRVQTHSCTAGPRIISQSHMSSETEV